MTTTKETQTRRRFLATLPGLLVGMAGIAQVARALDDHGRHGCAPRERARRGAGPAHPDPRPGIDGSHVLTKAQLTHAPETAPIFDMVRRIPQIADGIRCHCGCAEDPAYRSLLSCYEGEGMAQHCEICQGQGKLAFELFGKGQSLAQIRAAIDEKFG